MILNAYVALAIAAGSAALGGWAAWRHQGAKLETCAQARQNLGQQISDQNAAIDAVRALNDQTQAQAQAQAAKARLEAAAALARANKRGNAPASCDMAFAALDEE